MTAPSKRPVSAKVLKSRLTKKLMKLRAECDSIESKISELDKVHSI